MKNKICFNCGEEIIESEPDARPFIYHECPDGFIACIMKDKPVKQYNHYNGAVKDKIPNYFLYYF